MAKRLMVLATLLGLMLVTAGVSVAFAQQGQYGGEEVVVTGVVEDFGTAVEGATQYGVRDAATGGVYYLAGDFDFDALLGQSVTAYGTTEVVVRSVVLNVTRIEPADKCEVVSPTPELCGAETVTATFELAVECDPSAETGFSASVGEAPSAVGALLDGDGDGVYTTSLPVERGMVQEARIERLDPISDEPQAPLVASTIEDFGPVLFDEDKTFEASISFCEGGGGSGSGTLDGTGGGKGVLPATGGALPIAGLASALMLAGGLMVRRVSR